MSPKQSPPSSHPISGSQIPQQSRNLADEYVKSLQSESTERTSASLPPKVPKKPPVPKAKPRWPLLTPEETKAAGPEKAMTTNEVSEATDGVMEYSGVDARVDDSEAWCGAQSQNVSEVAPRYHDKAEGLSWQQRLEQLDFSDDEDDHEDEAPQSFLVKS